MRKEMSSPKNARPQASSTSRSFKVLRLLSPSLDCLAGDDQLLLRLSSCARLRFATLKSFCSCFSLIIATNFFYVIGRASAHLRNYVISERVIAGQMDARFGVRKYFASNFITAMNATPEVFCHAIGDLSYKAVLASKMGPLRSNSSRHLVFFFRSPKLYPGVQIRFYEYFFTVTHQLLFLQDLIGFFLNTPGWETIFVASQGFNIFLSLTFRHLCSKCT